MDKTFITNGFMCDMAIVAVKQSIDQEGVTYYGIIDGRFQ
jgi:hypothetical protein